MTSTLNAEKAVQSVQLEIWKTRDCPKCGFQGAAKLEYHELAHLINLSCARCGANFGAVTPLDECK